MARIFADYTPEQLLSLSVIMAVLISREYDPADQVILSDLLNAVSTNLGFIIDQKAYLDELYEKDDKDKEDKED